MEQISAASLMVRFEHHVPPSTERIKDHALIREELHEAAFRLWEICPQGRELSLAITKLEEAMFWANAALARKDKQ